MIKKIIIIVAIIVGLFIYDKQVNYYEMEGVVYADEGDVLVLLDNTNNLWEIEYTNILKVGDKIKIEFNTNGTDTERIDDVITAIIKQ